MIGVLGVTGTSSEALAEAARLFEAGDYAASAATYDAIAQQGPANGQFYLSQGNAHFLAGHLPEAILAYRRAERYIPNDARLRANLADARARVADPPAKPASVWPAWLPRLSRPLQLWLAVVGYVLGWIFLTVWLWRRERWSWLAGGILIVAAMALGTHLMVLNSAEARFPLAVIALDGVPLRKGNGESYPAYEINRVEVRLNRGVEARVRGQRKNDWLQLELPNGLVGWAPSEAVLLDREPRPLE